VQQLEKVTQQNAAMVEEATAASASLEEQAEALQRAVGSFKLAEGTSRVATAAPAPAQPAPGSKVATLPRHEAKPGVAELPRKREEKRPEGKPGSTKDEGWEEF
jgi:methyl-accepting chemotaxis protein-1 (serine sensor receptor)